MFNLHKTLQTTLFAGTASQKQSKCVDGLQQTADDEKLHHRGVHVTSGERPVNNET